MEVHEVTEGTGCATGKLDVARVSARVLTTQPQHQGGLQSSGQAGGALGNAQHKKPLCQARQHQVAPGQGSGGQGRQI